MTTSLNALVAGEHAADLRRAAEQYSLGRAEQYNLGRAEQYNLGSFKGRSGARVVALRQADVDDAGALRVLAELDEQPELSGGVLLALVDGEIVAAMSLGDGRVVANPFVATAGAVALLRVRAQQLAGVAVRWPRLRRPRRRLRPRFA